MPPSTISKKETGLRLKISWFVSPVMGNQHGSYYSVSDHHLPRYLEQFGYRFNRRFSLDDTIPG